MTVNEMMAGWRWRPIRNCPGRFVLRLEKGEACPGFEELLGEGSRPRVFVVAGAKDPVAVQTLEDGGLISYRKPDGRHVHTLNTREGFHRKLSQLGIDASALQPECRNNGAPARA